MASLSSIHHAIARLQAVSVSPLPSELVCVGPSRCSLERKLQAHTHFKKSLPPSTSIHSALRSKLIFATTAGQDTATSTLVVQEVDFVWKGEGSQVLLTGDFLSWDAKLTLSKGADGAFHCKQKLSPGTYKYKYIIDGVWAHSPDSPMIEDGKGGFNNQITVTEAALANRSNSKPIAEGASATARTKDLSPAANDSTGSPAAAKVSADPGGSPKSASIPADADSMQKAASKPTPTADAEDLPSEPTPAASKPTPIADAEDLPKAASKPTPAAKPAAASKSTPAADVEGSPKAESKPTPAVKPAAASKPTPAADVEGSGSKPTPAAKPAAASKPTPAASKPTPAADVEGLPKAESKPTPAAKPAATTPAADVEGSPKADSKPTPAVKPAAASKATPAADVEGSPKAESKSTPAAKPATVKPTPAADGEGSPKTESKPTPAAKPSAATPAADVEGSPKADSKPRPAAKPAAASKPTLAADVEGSPKADSKPTPAAKLAAATPAADVEGSPKAESKPTPAAKPAAASKPGAKPAKKAVDKPYPQIIIEDVIPKIKTNLQKEQDISDVNVVFQDNQLEGSFVKKGIVYTFWAFFPDGKLEGSRGFSLSSHGAPPSTVEPFLIDEKKITADLLVFWVSLYYELTGTTACDAKLFSKFVDRSISAQAPDVSKSNCIYVGCS